MHEAVTPVCPAHGHIRALSWAQPGSAAYSTSNRVPGRRASDDGTAMPHRWLWKAAKALAQTRADQTPTQENQNQQQPNLPKKDLARQETDRARWALKRRALARSRARLKPHGLGCRCLDRRQVSVQRSLLKIGEACKARSKYS